jgi:hypothetical protein
MLATQALNNDTLHQPNLVIDPTRGNPEVLTHSLVEGEAPLLVGLSVRRPNKADDAHPVDWVNLWGDPRVKGG